MWNFQNEFKTIFTSLELAGMCVITTKGNQYIAKYINNNVDFTNSFNNFEYIVIG